jgi:hypothetical protein
MVGQGRYARLMSVAEIKAALREMSAQERKEVAQALVELRKEEEQSPRVAESFSEAKAYVFDNYGDLLRRLAQ